MKQVGWYQSIILKRQFSKVELSFNPLPDNKILDPSKLKEIADDNFKFDENCGKLSKRVENTVGKREIARYEQFLIFPQCFQRACFPGASKVVIVWEWVIIQKIGQERKVSTVVRLRRLTWVDTFRNFHKVPFRVMVHK